MIVLQINATRPHRTTRSNDDSCDCYRSNHDAADELFGQAPTKQIEWGRNPRQMQKIEAMRAAAKLRRADGGKSSHEIRSQIGPLPLHTAR